MAVYESSKEYEDVYKALSEDEGNLRAFLRALAGVLSAASQDDELR